MSGSGGSLDSPQKENTMLFRKLVLMLALASLLVFSLSRSDAQAPSTAPASLAPYVPTPQDVVNQMLSLARVTSNDVVYDLGCGDGRIPITAAKMYGARGVGVDIDPRRIMEANANAKTAGVEKLVRFRLRTR